MDSLKLDLISYLLEFLDIQSIIHFKYINKKLKKASPIKNDHMKILYLLKNNKEIINIEEISRVLNFIKNQEIKKTYEQNLIMAYLLINKITLKTRYKSESKLQISDSEKEIKKDLVSDLDIDLDLDSNLSSKYFKENKNKFILTNNKISIAFKESCK